MQGTIQNPANQNGQGVILGDDGVTYTYTMLGWRDAATPATSGMRVDFDTRGAHAVAIYAVPDALRPLANPAPPPMAPQAPPAAAASSGMASATHSHSYHWPCRFLAARPGSAHIDPYGWPCRFLAACSGTTAHGHSYNRPRRHFATCPGSAGANSYSWSDGSRPRRNCTCTCWATS